MRFPTVFSPAMRAHFLSLFLALFLLPLAACSPTLDWREIKATEAPYQVMLPGKPAVHARELVLNQVPLKFTVRGTEREGLTFAVGSGLASDAAQASSLLPVMRESLLNNLGPARRLEAPDAAGTIKASGSNPQGKALSLQARLVQDGPWVYQLVIFGRSEAMNTLPTEAADTFFGSFRSSAR